MLFLQGILEITKDRVYFDGSNTTNRILDVLEEGIPKIICIDELDKMPRTFQNQLLNFMESGRVIRTNPVIQAYTEVFS
jgi:MoxR-like ATPase